MPPDRHIATFEGERRRLAGLAYRMTGSVAETEDILQQAWLRFAGQDLAALESPARWLTTVVSRLSLDHLKSARRQRETYVGAWLPEPLLESPEPTPEQQWMVTEDVSIALILLLETLSPEMRAAFLLRDAFDYEFEEIAPVVGRTPATCRQLVSRARKRLAGAEPPEAASLDAARPIITAFWEASREGDMQRLLEIFAEDIAVHTDGGGKVPAAINVLSGARRAAGLFVGLARKRQLPQRPCPPLRRINGAPGFISVDPAGVVQTTAVSLRNGRIAALWIVRNPDKLRHLGDVAG
ncbi:RNA polymerase sigma factor SigJ [Roseovarius sp.]|uniref:RNA polymerase sigma factor SigJ n=1 Tax=Roseovarius sp. TaxID=1486281 RepID=UPI003BA9B8F4